MLDTVVGVHMLRADTLLLPKCDVSEWPTDKVSSLCLLCSLCFTVLCETDKTKIHNKQYTQ